MSHSSLTLNAVDILGSNRQRGELRMMVRALSLHSWLNDQEDRLRLAAARHVLAHWPEYVAAGQAKRDAKGAWPRVVHAVDAKPSPLEWACQASAAEWQALRAAVRR